MNLEATLPLSSENQLLRSYVANFSTVSTLGKYFSHFTPQ